MWSDRHPIRIAEAGGKYAQSLSVGAHLQQAAVVIGLAAAVPLQVVKIAVRIGFQARGKFMGICCDMAFIIEVLIEVGLTIVIAIVKRRDLIASQNVDQFFRAAFDNFQAEGLKQACRIATPCYPLQVIVDAADQPHVAMCSADCSVAIGEEVDAAGKKQRVEPVFERNFQGVDHVGVCFRGDFAASNQWFSPLRRSRLSQLCQVLTLW